MIIGNGLIANEFRRYDADNILVLASGVSDSTTTDHKEFDREVTLIKSAIAKSSRKLLYFSTTSIEYKSTPYVTHKLKCESLVRESGNYLIFRLPQVVGHSGNPNNLFNIILSKLLNHELIVVSAKYRNFIDVVDICDIASLCVNQSNQIINIATVEPMLVVDIITIFSEVLNVAHRINVQYQDELKSANSPIVDDTINRLKIKVEGYTKRVIEKYAGHHRRK